MGGRTASNCPHICPPPPPPFRQAEQLRSYFERCNGRKECLDLLVHEFGGMFKKSQISRQLKLMGLQRGKFTPRQVCVCVCVCSS